MEKEFGEYLRKLRKNKKLTLTELANKTGLSQPYLSQIENGKRAIPSVEILNNLKDCLEANSVEFMNKAGITPTVGSLSEAFGFGKPEEVKQNTFDLHSLLVMNAEVFYKDKVLNQEDKEFLLGLLERTFGNR